MALEGHVGALVLIAGGVIGLYGGAELLVRGAGRLALGVGLRAATVGVTVIAFATTAPELVVAIIGALEASTDIGLGTVIGSNVANIGLVLGVAAIIQPLSISDTTMRRHVPFMVLAALLIVVLSIDGSLGRLDGVILLGVLAAFTAYLVYTVNAHPTPGVDAREGIRLRDVGFVVGGLLVLVIASRWIITGGRSILVDLGFSDLFIGITLLAIGTSLPELAASAVGAARGDTDFAIGNVVGSNIYNIHAVLGLTAVAIPISVSPATLRYELPLLVGFTLVLVAMMGVGKRLTRLDGTVLVVGYLGFIYFLFP